MLLWENIGKLIVASIVGTIIGTERGVQNKNVGVVIYLCEYKIASKYNATQILGTETDWMIKEKYSFEELLLKYKKVLDDGLYRRPNNKDYKARAFILNNLIEDTKDLLNEKGKVVLKENA